jgi:multidrug efflux pump subunit AcrB
VARVSVAPDPAEITHDSVSRSLDVTAQIHGRSAAAVSQDVTTHLRRMDFPYEFRAEVAGDAVARAENRQWILLSGIVVLVLGYLLLQAATGSWRGAAVLLVAVPLAAVGGLLAAQLTGGVLTGGVLAAVFSLMALALRQALVLVRRAQQLRDDDVAADEAMRRAVRQAAVPVCGVALATAAFFLPAALLPDGPGLELLRPFSITLLVGLISTVAVVLVVVPGLYPRLAGLHPSPVPPESGHDDPAVPPMTTVPAPRSDQGEHETKPEQERKALR